jgi:hypothetical protein
LIVVEGGLQAMASSERSCCSGKRKPRESGAKRITMKREYRNEVKGPD